jgi:hypothetical protein
MSESVSHDDLVRVQKWAKEKIAQGSEPPWAWYQYMKLIETIQALVAGMDCTVSQTENSPQSAKRPDAHLRLVDPTDRQDNARHHPAGMPVNLPT